jgi:hypothetical protein
LNGNISISSDLPPVDFLVVLGLGATFTNLPTIRLCIARSNITGTGTGRAPSVLYTNANIIKASNTRPSSPLAFRCLATNVTSVHLTWPPQSSLRDFHSFIIQNGTTNTALSNRMSISNGTVTNIWFTGLKALQKYFFRLKIRDMAGLTSTNMSVIQVKTRLDMTPPDFDESSLKITVNQQVARMLWKRAQDPEQSLPITYEVYVREENAAWPALPTLSTTNTNTSVSLLSGSFEIMVRARDKFGNKSPAWPGLSVLIGVTSDLDHVYLYPNPAGKNDILRFNNFTDDSTVALFNIKGEMILETQDKNISLPGHLAAGVYYVVIRDQTGKKILKLVYTR